MRKLSLFLCICSSIFLLNFTVSSDNFRTVIEQEQAGDISATLKIHNQPKLSNKGWIKIEFQNNTEKAIPVLHSFYSIDCNIYDKKNGKLIKQGRIAGRNASELFDHVIDSPIPMSNLNPGLNISSKHPSTIGTLLLSAINRSEVYVEASLNLSIEFAGQKPFNFKWENINFNFTWTKPEPSELSKEYQYLNYLLDNPAQSILHHYELITLLSVSEISERIGANTLLEALKIRSTKEDGRHAILFHLNDHFNNEQEFLDYYFEQLKTADPKIVEELSMANDIWDDRFLEPLIDFYKKADTGNMYRIMNLLDLHQDKWKNKSEISGILSDLLLYKFDELIYAAPKELSKHQLLQVSLVIDMLGKTKSEEVIPIICPFLNEKMSILDSGLVLDTESIELPRPIRVCDNALEAILRLKGKNLIKTYNKLKFQPPYENGEGEIIISRIRDLLIQDLKNKGKVCR